MLKDVCRGLLPLAVSAMLTGCVNDYMTDCPAVEGSANNPVTLKIQMYAPDIKPYTRASEHTETNDGTLAENFINIEGKDYYLYILDKDGYIMQSYDPKAVAIEKVEEGDEINLYNLKVTFMPDGMDEIQVMALANWNGFSGSYDRIGIGNATSMTALYKDAANFNFAYNPVTSGGVTSTWVPTLPDASASTSGTGIPMAGMSAANIKVPKGDGINTPEIKDVSINMLRSLAKIEIVDAIPDDKRGGVEIEKCVLTAYNDKGRFIPDGTQNTGWTTLGTQVETPSIPADVNLLQRELQFVSGTTNYEVEITNETASTTTTEKRPCFTAYIPEMLLENLTDEERPIINVYVKDVEKPYTIELSTYANGKPQNPYKSLLRNHIYQFNVKSAGVEVQLELLIETPKWNVDDDQEWAFEDAAVGFAEEGKFQWINPDYEVILDDSERVLLTGYSADDASYGKFQFKPLAANNSCTWTLSLIADDNTKNDHFTIQIKNGEEWEDCGAVVSRDLNSDMVEFRIMATEANGSATDYTARLVMTVQTFDGRVAILNLTGTTVYDSSDDKFYYVVKQITNGGDNM